MNRDLLYSLGLALAAWPPLVGRPYQGVEPPALERPALQAEARTEEDACVELRAAGLGRSETRPSACADRKEAQPKP